MNSISREAKLVDEVITCGAHCQEVDALSPDQTCPLEGQIIQKRPLKDLPEWSIWISNPPASSGKA